MNKRILIVDDNYLARKLLEKFFEFYGYEVHCVESGREALSLIEAGHYDILITDYIMPEIDGVELTRMVRRIRPLLPILGMSASCEEKKFLEAGANFFIPKPFDLKTLKNAVEHHCRKMHNLTHPHTFE